MPAWNLFTQENERRDWSQLSAWQVFGGKTRVLEKSRNRRKLSLSRFHYSAWFSYFYTFPSMLRCLSSESFNNIFSISYQRSLNTDWIFEWIIKKIKNWKKKKACLPRFTHEAPAPRSSYELVETCPCVPDRIGIWKCWCLRRGENQSTRRKTSRSKGENQKQTEPTYRVDAGSWTQATLVGGESHHCAITCSPRLCAWRLNTHYLCHALLFHCIFAGEYKCLSSLLN